MFYHDIGSCGMIECGDGIHLAPVDPGLGRHCKKSTQSLIGLLESSAVWWAGCTVWTGRVDKTLIRDALV